MIGIVVSRADEASVNIGDQLLDLADWTSVEEDVGLDEKDGDQVHRTEGFELRTFEDLHLHLEDVAAAFEDPAFVVFVSRHAGDTGPLLTAHFTGNFGVAEYGGRDYELARACPNAHARIVEALSEHAPDGYEVGIECTHHGPSRVGAPSMFVEVGSDAEQWRDPGAARAVAKAVLDLRNVEPTADRTLVGFGGGHYAPRFCRIVRETTWRVGHIGADWGLATIENLVNRSDVIQQAFERSDADVAVVDGDRPALEEEIHELGFRTVSETWIRAVGSAPLSLVEELENRIGPVDGGLRFGDSADDHGGEVSVIDLPDDLLSEARGIDDDRTRSVAETHLVAFETEEGGTRVCGQGAIASPEDRGELVDALCEILREKYDSVEREADVVLARRSGFDPGRARELGIPEGPKYGALASGEAVTVDGEEIDPEQVSSEQTERFRLR